MVEVVTEVQRRRRWSVQDKVRLVEETFQPGMSVSFVARKYGLSPSLLFKWRKLMSQGGQEAIRAEDQVVGMGEVKALKKQVRELQRLLGKKTMEVEILKEAIEIAHEKKLISHMPLSPGGDSL